MNQTELNQPRRSYVAGRIVGIFLLLAVGVFVGRYVVPANSPVGGPLLVSVSEEGQRQLLFPTFWEAWDAIHQNYIGEVDDKDLLYGAVAGMVRAVGDPYTVFTDPADSEQFRETLSGQFSGVGIEIGARGGLVRVIAPLEGTPAAKAGIRAGDVILAVDDEPISPEATIDDVVQKIRGQRGTEVKLQIARQEEEQVNTQDYTLVRDNITIESVRMERTEDGIAVIELLTFNADTEQQFAEIARQLAQNKPRGIILDVRNNPGGFLQTAVDIASHFLPTGTLVVSERGDSEVQHITRGNPNLANIPLVVLVNGGSASASEIIAGALHEKAGAPVIGEKTFGKGSVQELVPLKDGSNVRVTVAKWFTPDGVSIDDSGIEPSVVAEDNADSEEDEQLQRAVEEILTITNGGQGANE